MKYLKRFNESINREDVRDILLELNDIGMRSYIYDTEKYITIITPSVHHQLTGRFTYLSELEDCVLRIIDYLGDNFDSVWFRYFKLVDNTWRQSDLAEMNIEGDALNTNLKLDWPISVIKIKYKE